MRITKKQLEKLITEAIKSEVEKATLKEGLTPTQEEWLDDAEMLAVNERDIHNKWKSGVPADSIGVEAARLFYIDKMRGLRDLILDKEFVVELGKRVKRYFETD